MCSLLFRAGINIADLESIDLSYRLTDQEANSILQNDWPIIILEPNSMICRALEQNLTVSM